MGNASVVMTTVRDMSQWIELQQQKQLQKLKTVAFASAAHEFRNPLNSILQSLELLAQFVTTPEAEKFFVIARNCCNLLLFLVNDILDYSQHDANKLVLNMDQIVSIEHIIRDCVEILKFKADMKKIALIAQVPERFPDDLLLDGNRVQ